MKARIRARARWLGALGIVIGLLASGCGGDTAPTLPMRLVDDPGIRRNDARLDYGASVTIGGDTRRVLAAVKPVVLPTEIVPSPNPETVMASTTVPDALKVTPRLLVGPANLVDGRPVVIRTWPVTNASLSGPFRLPINLAQVTPGRSAVLALWPVPPLEERDIETGPVRVPRGAVLQFALGFEPACFGSALLPATMRIAATDENGTETLVHEAPLKLTGYSSAQRWLDLSVPLPAAIAGHTVRFRFTTRIAGPPQLQYHLPVFAEPTLVAAPPGGR